MRRHVCEHTDKSTVENCLLVQCNNASAATNATVALATIVDAESVSNTVVVSDAPPVALPLAAVESLAPVDDAEPLSTLVDEPPAALVELPASTVLAVDPPLLVVAVDDDVVVARTHTSGGGT